jgi:hypothetical protein
MNLSEYHVVRVRVLIDVTPCGERWDVRAQVGGLPLLASSNGHYRTKDDAFWAGHKAATNWEADNA